MGRKRKDGYDGIGLTVTLYVAGIAAALVILGAMLRSGHALKALLMSVLQGVAALFAVNVLGTLTGVTLAVNWWTLGISSLGGTAGVVFLLVFECNFVTEHTKGTVITDNVMTVPEHVRKANCG